jgi:glycosyltransferase involved in cell wall biosynthesis
MKKVLIFIDWYYPAYKAGGPIQSCKNLVAALQNKIQFYIFTSNTDFDKKEALAVSADKWVQGNYNEQIYYCSKANYSYALVKQVIKDLLPDCMYVNSMFSFPYAIQPIWAAKKLAVKTIVAPRGMLQQGAMQFKSTKKNIFLKLLKLTNALQYTSFQATDDQEKKDIEKYFSNQKQVTILQNFAVAPQEQVNKLPKSTQQLKLVYLSRIVPKKNLDFVLTMLLEKQQLTNISLDIYGDVGDKEYWEKCQILIRECNSIQERVFFKGPLENSIVRTHLQQYHFYILATHGENFGHSIYEALAAAKPILISNKTPWTNLQQKKVGWDLALESKKEWLDTLEQIYNMQQNEFDRYSEAALDTAKQYFNNSNLTNDYIKLFTH